MTERPKPRERPTRMAAFLTSRASIPDPLDVFPDLNRR
jgi:hypothetical protein